MNQKVSTQLASAAGSFAAELYARHGVYFSCVPLIRLVGGWGGVKGAKKTKKLKGESNVWSSLHGKKENRTASSDSGPLLTNYIEKSPGPGPRGQGGAE